MAGTDISRRLIIFFYLSPEAGNTPEAGNCDMEWSKVSLDKFKPADAAGKPPFRAAGNREMKNASGRDRRRRETTTSQADVRNYQSNTGQLRRFASSRIWTEGETTRASPTAASSGISLMLSP